MSDNTVIWVHGDCLSPHNPAFINYPESPAIFVWDDTLLDARAISLKRITFIYECLLELPVVIRRGDIAQEVAKFTADHSANRIVTVGSPSPRFNLICDEIIGSLMNDVTIEILEIEPFVEYDGQIDLKRFSKYWRTVKKYVVP